MRHTDRDTSRKISRYSSSSDPMPHSVPHTSINDKTRRVPSLHALLRETNVPMCSEFVESDESADSVVPRV